MKIEASMKITELPRHGWVGTVNPDIDIEIEKDQYTIAEAVEIRDALTRIIEYASFGAPELAAERKREPRVFGPDDPLPDDLRKVTDREGDAWVRSGRDAWVMKGGPAVPYTSQYLLNEYSPLTEVIES